MSSTAFWRGMIAGLLLGAAISAMAAKHEDKTTTREKPPPTDHATLNEFGQKHNAYIISLQQGAIDIRLWRQSQAAWERLK